MTYPGGKNGAGTYQKLINLMPPHDVYVEPFLGSGAVMRLKRPAALNIGLDLVGSQLTAVSAELVKGGVAAGSIVVDDGIRRRRAPLPAMEYSNAGIDDGIRYRLIHGCAIAFLDNASAELARRPSLVYCDPPYLRSTRSGRDLYEFEMNDRQHRRLLRALLKVRCNVMISGYWSSLYAAELQGWNVFQFDAMTRGGLATETVWYNFAAPVELHDYRYLGVGFRERERIKRKKQRWVNRLAKMPILEQQALLSALAGLSRDLPVHPLQLREQLGPVDPVMRPEALT
jgi:hypothetical protein